MKKIEFREIQNYLVGLVAGVLIIAPEFIKIIFCLFYLYLFYAVLSMVSAPIFQTEMGSLIGVLILLIAPIGSYCFYKDSVFAEAYTVLVKWVIQYTDLIKVEDLD